MIDDEVRWIYVCDICKQEFEDPMDAVRLKRVGDYVVVAGFGSGMADGVVHKKCLMERGTQIGNLGSPEEREGT